MSSRLLPISIVIPTYRREAVLLDTLRDLLALSAGAREILVVDQTEHHEAATRQGLQDLHDAGDIRWLRLALPSITHAMNHGLLAAKQPVVLFLDDDIRPGTALVEAHFRAHEAHGDVLVAGRVIQPWDSDPPASDGGRFHFNSLVSAWPHEFMGGNFSLRRETAMSAGGFDENFVRVAYRFEAEFAHRLLAGGRRIYYEPAALLHHLKAEAGGTRSYGDHLSTWRPDHAVGAYYYGLRTGALSVFVLRPLRAVRTRYHLRHPWRIPGTLWAELCGMIWAACLFTRGPKYLSSNRAA
jgi:GT2 family glycosyltransferase